MPPVSFSVTLSSPPAGGVVGGSPGVGTIYPGTVPGPSVSSVSSVSGNEGTSLVHTVTLSAATTASTNYAYSLGGGTSTSVSDYTVPPTFSAGVTLSGGTLTVPSGVSSFTVSVAAISDGLTESSETYFLTIGGISGTGTIGDVGATLITPGVLVSRTSGVAPLYVQVNASGTVASAYTSNPFHDLAYSTNFGDSGAGNWAEGMFSRFSAPRSKNVERGPMTAHVYETPGAYTIQVTIFNDIDSTVYTHPVVITVEDPDFVFASTTVSLSNNTDHTGAPGVATHVDNVTDWPAELATQLAAGKRRILVKRSVTSNISTSFLMRTDGPGILGAFGSGAKPKFTATVDMAGMSFSQFSTVGLNDWRVMDWELDGGNIHGNSAGFYLDGAFDQLTFIRCKTGRVKTGYLASPGNIATANEVWDQLCYYECEGVDSSGTYPAQDGGNAFYVAGRRLSILGCKADPNGGGEHAIRTSYSDQFVYAHNAMFNVVNSKAYLSVRAPGLDTDPDPTASSAWKYNEGGVVYTQKGYCYDNYFDPTGVPGTPSSLGCGGINQDHGTGRSRNIIFEANYLINGVIGMSGSKITTRNNLITKPAGGIVFSLEHQSAQPDITDGWIYNNSVYVGGGNGIFTDLIGGSMAGGNLTARNNLLYGPSAGDYDGASLFYVNGSVALPLTESNNTTPDNNTTSPLFTTNPPVVPADWKPTTGSYAITGGMAVPVWEDLLGIALTGATRCLGAVKN